MWPIWGGFYEACKVYSLIHLVACRCLVRRRRWHPTPILLPGKSHGRRILVGCSPWGLEESDITEWLYFHALEKEMATLPSVLAWRIPGTGEPGGLQSMGSRRDTTERLHFNFSLSCIGEGNGNPLQCSCLENPRDGGVLWAAISGVAQSPTRLKLLSSSSSRCLVVPEVFIENLLGFNQKHLIKDSFSVQPIKM